jgi:hypothetical protein
MGPGDWLFEGGIRSQRRRPETEQNLRLSKKRLNFEPQVILDFEHR